MGWVALSRGVPTSTGKKKLLFPLPFATRAERRAEGELGWAELKSCLPVAVI
jgi:hypothetical protein